MQQRNDIQGIRALAVVAVVLFHVNDTWLSGGFIGVDVFFVVSGYLITSIVLLQKSRGDFSFIDFYLARIRRIVPAYMWCLSLVSLAMAILLIPRDFDTFWASLKSALYFNSNDYFAAQNDYFAPESHELPLLHTWSLAIEMKFYLLLPALLILVPKRFLGWVLSAIFSVLLAYSIYELSEGQRQSVYFSLAARVPEFLVGSILAISKAGSHWSPGKRNSLAFLGMGMILSSFFLITDELPFPGLLALPSCFGVALIIASHNSLVNRILCFSPFVWVGALSYSIYLWHWPILAAARYYFESYNLNALVLVCSMVLTLLLSYFSYRFVEVPFRQWRNHQRIELLGRLPLGVLIAGFLVFSSSLNSGLLPALPPEVTRYAKQSEICHGKIIENCVQGDLQSEKTLLLLGDSHAAQLNYFAKVVGEALGVKFHVITASSCVPIRGFDAERIKGWAQESCRSQIEEAKKHIAHSEAVLLAGMWKYHYLSDGFIESMHGYFEEMDKQSKPLLVLSQIPMLEGDVQRAHRFEALGVPKAIRDNGEWKIANQRINSLVSDYPGTQFMDLSSHEIFSNAPFYLGDMIYMDSHHLNEIGAHYYGEAATPYIKEWLASEI